MGLPDDRFVGFNPMTDDDIRGIRADPRCLAAIANDYNLSKQAINKIKHRKSYKDVPGPAAVLSNRLRNNKFPKGKIPAEKILLIRADARKLAEIAVDFAIDPVTVWNIKHGVYYGHVMGPPAVIISKRPTRRRLIAAAPPIWD
jgi:hypothetical protein